MYIKDKKLTNKSLLLEVLHMTRPVPSATIILIIIALVFSFAFPIGLCIFFHKKKGAAILPFFVGCIVFLLFALVLESIAHQLILGSSFGAAIQDNILAFAIYGGVMAGLFEETGRFAAFKTVLRKYRDKDHTALMYGAGHGGFEVLALLGFTMVSNLVICYLINTGNLSVITDRMAGDQLAAFEASVNTLVALPLLDLCLSIVERVSAVIIHISLSVAVWFAAKDSRRLPLFPLAIILHTVVDAATVLMTDHGFSNLVIELVILGAACLFALFAQRIWRSAHR